MKQWNADITTIIEGNMKNPEILRNSTYDYEQLLRLKRGAPKNSSLEQDILTLEFRTERRDNLDFELEMRYIIMKWAVRGDTRK